MDKIRTSIIRPKISLYWQHAHFFGYELTLFGVFFRKPTTCWLEIAEIDKLWGD